MMEFRIQRLYHSGWDTVAENCHRHSAMLMAESLSPREDTTIKKFKELKFRVVNSAGEVQE